MAEGIDPARYAERMLRAKAAVAEAGASALLVGVGPELEWLTGSHTQPAESMITTNAASLRPTLEQRDSQSVTRSFGVSQRVASASKLAASRARARLRVSRLHGSAKRS